MSLALTGATIYCDPVTVLRGASVVVEGSQIAAVGSHKSLLAARVARTVDCAGMTIVAGFWNCHVHFFERKWADAQYLPAEELERQLRETYTRFGFTSVFDLGSAWDNTRRIRDRIGCGEVAGPRIRSTGEGLLPAGGAPSDDVMRVMGVVRSDFPEITSPEKAADAARALLDRGTDGLKLFASGANGKLLTLEEMSAAASVAHEKKKPVFVHPNTPDDVLRAIEAGANVIAHTTPGAPWLAGVVQSAKGLALTPTLTVWKSFLKHDRISVQEARVESAVSQLRQWREAGGTIVFGTDLGAVDPEPAQEFALMSDAGLGFSEILASLTTTPARLFGDSKNTGRIADGLQADLVVLGSDPAKSTGALSDVRMTVRNGEIVC